MSTIFEDFPYIKCFEGGCRLELLPYKCFPLPIRFHNFLDQVASLQEHHYSSLGHLVLALTNHAGTMARSKTGKKFQEQFHVPCSILDAILDVNNAVEATLSQFCEFLFSHALIDDAKFALIHEVRQTCTEVNDENKSQWLQMVSRLEFPLLLQEIEKGRV